MGNCPKVILSAMDACTDLIYSCFVPKLAISETAFCVKIGAFGSLPSFSQSTQ